MENLREHILAIVQSSGLDESRVDRLVRFTTNWQEHEPSTVRKVMTAVLTALGALIVGGSFIGFLAGTLELTGQFPLFLIIGLSFFPAAFFYLLFRRETVGMTLMIIGLIASGAPALIDFGAGEAYLLIFLISQLKSGPVGLSATVLLNLLVGLFLSVPIKAIPLRLSARIQPVLLTGITLAATLFAFVLTFEAIYDDRSKAGEIALTLYNVFFFAATGAMVWFGKRRNSRRLVWIGAIFWFAFLFYKYYDLLWNLLDKSVVLILLGLIFIGAGYTIQRRVAHET